MTMDSKGEWVKALEIYDQLGGTGALKLYLLEHARLVLLVLLLFIVIIIVIIINYYYCLFT